MKTLKCFFLPTLFFFIISCQNNAEQGAQLADSVESKSMENEFGTTTPPQSEETPPPSPPADPEPPQQPAQTQPEKQPAIPRQIIKTAHYRIQVKNVDASTAAVNVLAAKFGGYVSGQEMTNSSYQITNLITIRVPANQFDALLEGLGKEAIFTQFKKITSEDVTEEYVDITTRLKTKKEVRDRYVDILRNKARTVSDVLKAEEQIRIIQEEIEAQEGRLRYLKDQVGMSTINLEIYQEVEFRAEPSVYKKSFGDKLLGALENGWDLVLGLVVFMVNIWPLILIGVLVFWQRRRLFGRFRKK